MATAHPGDFRATLWPSRLAEIRRKLNRSSLIIITLGLLALAGNAFWVWHDRARFTEELNPLVIGSWFHPAHVNSLVIAVIILYALRQIARTRQKLAPLGYPLLASEEKHRGVEIWKSVEPLTKRPAILHIIHPERTGLGGAPWREVSHRWVRRTEKARRLTSPHIARVLDVGYAQHERFYTVIEMPRGLRLQDLVEQHGPLPANRAVFIAAQLAHAVQEAHAAGLSGLSLHPRHCWIGHRSSNCDWLTVMLSGYSAADDGHVSPADDVRAFARIIIGLLAGRWIAETAGQAEVVGALDRCELPYGVAEVLRRCLAAGTEDALPPLDELARRMWDALPGPCWNNDRAAAWWREHHPDRSAP